MKYSEVIRNTFNESASAKKETSDKCAVDIEKAGILCADVLRSGGKLMLCGNGGSASDAQHIVAELVIRLSSRFDRKPLAALALTANSSVLTAGGNDYGFDTIFSRQVEALGKPGDLLVCISTSGNSGNVTKALESAKSLDIHTVAFLGSPGGKMKGKADIDIIIPNTTTARIQECHITIGHIICDIIERELFPSD